MHPPLGIWKNTKIPYSIHDRTDEPVSLYAATKKANELFAHTYQHLYSIKTTGSAFTVYGPGVGPIWHITLLPRKF